MCFKSRHVRTRDFTVHRFGDLDIRTSNLLYCFLRFEFLEFSCSVHFNQGFHQKTVQIYYMKLLIVQFIIYVNTKNLKVI